MAEADFRHWPLSSWLDHLGATHPADIELGLDRVRSVAERLDCLRVAPKMVLIAGTNGKGTTSALLAELISRQGLRVGCYNSPHILAYNERVSVNGVDISDADLCAAFVAVEEARRSVFNSAADAGEDAQPVGLTYFEFGTLAALVHFKRLNRQRALDVCLLEIGLGGRLDAVNIAEADLCIVTSIGLDHQDWLGDSIDQIAYEKCAIARPDIPLICGQPSPPLRAKETVLSRSGLWVERGKDYDISVIESESNRSEPRLEVRFTPDIQEPLTIDWQLPFGRIPAANIATAIQALALLGLMTSEKDASEAVAKLKVAGRSDPWQLDQGNGQHLKLTLDVAHNPQAMTHLARKQGESHIRYEGILMAMLADKDIEAVVKCLPESERLWLAGLQCPRGLSAQELASRILATDSGNLWSDKIHMEDSIPLALDRLCQSGDSDAAVSSVQQPDLHSGDRGCKHWLVVGSFFTVEAAMTWIQQQNKGRAVWKNI